MESEKMEVLRKKINEIVENALLILDKENKLDYFNIEISNHQGNLQIQYSLKDRERVY